MATARGLHPTAASWLERALAHEPTRELATATTASSQFSDDLRSAPPATESHTHRYDVVDVVALAAQCCVKVTATCVAPSYSLPWLRGEEAHIAGSGFAVVLPSGARRLLTHAAVVEHATLVQVRTCAFPHKCLAEVESVGFDVDVAVLRVDDDEFWRGVAPLPLPHTLPSVMSEVLAAGFPHGGDELSTTRGVVNRILLAGAARELTVQTDASLNPGQVGGPVLSRDGELLGLAAAGGALGGGGKEGGAGDGGGGGLIVPMPVVHSFLRNMQYYASRGKPYGGKSTDVFRVQALENPSLRSQHGLPPRPTADGVDGGVLLTRLPPDANAAGVLREGDVLLALDGQPIAADGTVQLQGASMGVRVGMRHLVQRVALGDPLEYLVLRDGARQTLSVAASTRAPRLLPARLPAPRPEWLVIGGLVFVPLLPEYEALVPKSELPRIHGPPAFDGEQLVLLLRVLQAEVNIGYEDVCGMLHSCNGEKVTSLAHLHELVEGVRAAEAAEIEFILVTGELLVLDAPRCWADEADLFALHSIPRRCSLVAPAPHDVSPTRNGRPPAEAPWA